MNVKSFFFFKKYPPRLKRRILWANGYLPEGGIVSVYYYLFGISLFMINCDFKGANPFCYFYLLILDKSSHFLEIETKLPVYYSGIP